MDSGGLTIEALEAVDPNPNNAGPGTAEDPNEDPGGFTIEPPEAVDPNGAGPGNAGDTLVDGSKKLVGNLVSVALSSVFLCGIGVCRAASFFQLRLPRVARTG